MLRHWHEVYAVLPALARFLAVAHYRLSRLNRPRLGSATSTPDS